jgi:Ca2+-binding RTX toxin-like protein
VVDAGDGDDNIRVSSDPNQKGGVVVDVNGQKYHLSAEEARNLEIRGGKGNDMIIVDPDVKVGNWFDRLTNRGITLDGGDGDDILVGGSGNDTIRGGRGQDLILGGDGNDRINGGDGDDVIMDWSGNNRIRGGRGQDLVMGGQDLDDWWRNIQPLRA